MLIFWRSKFMFRESRNAEKSRWSHFKTWKNMKKVGRPILKDSVKLSYPIIVKLCTKDFNELKAKARQAGMTRTEFARLAIIGCEIRQRLTPEQMDCIRKIAGIGNNLNQIARKINAAGYTNNRGEYLYLADKIDNELNRIDK
jgi:hypothetical protein